MPTRGAAKLTTPLAAPSNYFELTFTADAGRPYRLWIRGRADDNCVLQRLGVRAVLRQRRTPPAHAAYRIGTTTATRLQPRSVQRLRAVGLGLGRQRLGTERRSVRGIYFAATGTHTIRIQTREDGLAIDQVVLSADAYLSAVSRRHEERHGDPAEVGRQHAATTATAAAAAGEIVLHAATATHEWSAAGRCESDTTAAGGQRLYNPNAGAAKVVSAARQPGDLLRADVQRRGRQARIGCGFAPGPTATTTRTIRCTCSSPAASTSREPRSTGSAPRPRAEFNLEACSGCGLSNWGWEDNGWGTGVLGPGHLFRGDRAQTHPHPAARRRRVDRSDRALRGPPTSTRRRGRRRTTRSSCRS